MNEHERSRNQRPGADGSEWEAGLADVLGVAPHPAALFLEALTHPSYPEEAPPPRPPHNQRLEFLGDAVVGLVAAELLWRRFPARPEGELARMRSALVNTRALADVARSLQLGRWLRMARGEELAGSRKRDSTLCDAFEAVVGAIFVAHGWDEARRFVQRHLAPRIDELARSSRPGLDPKTRLQELFQKTTAELPEYDVIAVEGPAHARTFTAVVKWRGRELGRGRGSTKKAAERAAAEAALVRKSWLESTVEADDSP